MSEEPAIQFSLYGGDGSLRWQPPPTPLPQPQGVVHVWRIATNRISDDEVDACRRVLSGDEIARAERFHYDRHRRRFIACRGTLRSILGRYVNETPERIAFEYGEWGKPRLAGAPSLEFNLSHAETLAVAAFTLDAAVGIDLEPIDRQVEMDLIAREFLPPADADAIEGAPADQRRALFFRSWTRQEATLKACGVGLTALDGAEGLEDIRKIAGQCEIRDLAIGSGYAGALALFRAQAAELPLPRTRGRGLG